MAVPPSRATFAAYSTVRETGIASQSTIRSCMFLVRSSVTGPALPDGTGAYPLTPILRRFRANPDLRRYSESKA